MTRIREEEEDRTTYRYVPQGKCYYQSGPDWYQSGPVVAILVCRVIGSPSAANVHTSH